MPKQILGWSVIGTIFFAIGFAIEIRAQQQSVRPGINDPFRDPNVKQFVGRFETESREIYGKRNEILAACHVQAGETVADIGAGTGLFTRMFAEAVGKNGQVVAVDISKKFLDHIEQTCKDAGRQNVRTVLCTADSVNLPADSVDLAFICDTYHHFEYPQKTLASIFNAVRPGGRLAIVDFRRVEGESSEWILNHVRAGQDAVEKEIVEAGFTKTQEEKGVLKENYFVLFAKPAKKSASVGFRRGPGRGMGRGPRPDVVADQDIFHDLLANHDRIRRSVTKLSNGVEALTESDDPKVAEKIKSHARSMHERIQQGRGLRYWDELFAEVFRHHADIRMSVDETEKGVRTIETSTNAYAATLIQAHAEVVSKFVADGFEEAHKNHEVPASRSVD